MTNPASTDGLHHGSPLPDASPEAAVPPPPAPSSNFTRGMRETIESIAVAFALAFLFKTFEAEAFVIPTGSMAPTLMGRHKDVTCSECGYHYTASGSEEAEHDGTLPADPGYQVVRCTCPICRAPMSVDPQDECNFGRDAKPSYSGDRIWVSKVAYHQPFGLLPPKRWDVIVFRFPEEAETYYIKRLIGLPNETVRIFHGDVYTRPTGSDEQYAIVRKPPDKVRAMAQIVHDNDYVSQTMVEHGWPARWQVWSREPVAGDWQPDADGRTYHTDGTNADEAWMRYQHVIPSSAYWRLWRDNSDAPSCPPQLITDFYAYNTNVQRRDMPPASFSGEDYRESPTMLGLNWVGDLILDCELDVQARTGEVSLDLVAAGRHFRATFNVSSGTVKLTIPGQDDWHRTAETSVRGAGTHRVMFANVDRQLLLWVDDKLVAFDEPTTYDVAGDDAPSSEGAIGAISLRSASPRAGSRSPPATCAVLRDIYYIATRSGNPGEYAVSRYFIDWKPGSAVMGMNGEDVAEFFSSPERWQNSDGTSAFDERQDVSFPLEADQFFVMGDNSPASWDAGCGRVSTSCSAICWSARRCSSTGRTR